MRNSKSNHPWRTATPGEGTINTIDPIVTSRSGRFAAYLAKLPPDERRKIESAERAFVSKANEPTSRQWQAARDYADGMLGLKDDDFDAAV
jgi:hypothetical protein